MPTRRDWLKAAAGLLMVREALARGRLEQGVRGLGGEVRINGEAARPGAEIRPGDALTTGADGELVFVVARDAFLLRRGSSVSFLADGFRMVTGKVLSVFASGERKRIRTGTATIGIRGTAVYVEAELERSYVCTCYGEAELEPVADPTAREIVDTTHHEEPRYIMGKGAPQMIQSAPVINHTDAELKFLESLVGRLPPFLRRGGRGY